MLLEIVDEELASSLRIFFFFFFGSICIPDESEDCHTLSVDNQ